MRALVLTVALHDRRFHGHPEWPPAPARLYQALVAGASPALEDDGDVPGAFRWLETLPPPVIAAPSAVLGRETKLFVPNNDLDTVGGDPEQLPRIRAAKAVQPRLLLTDDPFLYIWPVEDTPEPTAHLMSVAESLYQFGRGVDMAFARADVVPWEEAERMLGSYGGAVYRPSVGARSAANRKPAISLLVPCADSFNSLRRRYAAQGERFRVEGRGRKASTTFVQPPKARFRQVVYENPPERIVFELRPVGVEGTFAPYRLARAHDLAVALRDAARARLTSAIGREAEVDAVLLGTRPGEEAAIPGRLRARLVPLPSIGHEHTDPAIRRVLVEVPSGGPLPVGDIRWAFAGLQLGERVLVEAADDKMLTRFTHAARRWKSLTPVVLPAVRRRVDPRRLREEAKGAPERQLEEQGAVEAVRQALRHVGVRVRPARVAVSREPTTERGERAESFAAPPRFCKERLWHLDLEFSESVVGPLVIGDGRFLGLGVMRPVQDSHRILAWEIESGLEHAADPVEVAGHLRRAVISRASAAWGRRGLPMWVSGHSKDGSPATGHRHLCHALDLRRQRLVLFTPDGNEGWLETGRQRLADALEGMKELRAGRAGVLHLRPACVWEDDPLIASARRWQTLTRYDVNRHELAKNVQESIAEDVRASVRSLGLPRPASIDVSHIRSIRGVGASAHLVVTFAVAVRGPLLLGRSRHRGGGVMVAESN